MVDPLPSARHPSRALGAIIAAVLGIAGTAIAQEVQPPVHPEPPPVVSPAGGPDGPFEGRPIREVRLVRPVPGEPGRFEPLDAYASQFVRNNIRSVEGTEFHTDQAIEDARLLNRLERFATIEHTVELLDDGGVALTLILVQRPVIEDIQPVGNRRLSDRTIRDIAEFLVGTAVNDQIIDRVARDIEAAYRRKGYYRVQVAADQDELRETGILYFRVREGVRLRVTDIRFTAVDGDLVFTPAELRSTEAGIRTRTYNLFNKGLLDEDRLDEDVTALVAYYRDRGYLDVRVDRTITEAPNGKEAIVEFVITAGQRYTMRSVIAYYPERARFYSTLDQARAAAGPGEHLHVDDRGRAAVYTMGLYSSEQIAGLIEIKAGDVYSADKLIRSDDTIRNAFGKQGYINAYLAPDSFLRRQEKQDEAEPLVDLVFEIFEGRPWKTGLVYIHGNSLTRDGVIRRQVQVRPDHPLDTTGLDATEARLNGTGLFAKGPPFDRGRPPTITIQDENPANPGHRDILLEVEEANTGAFNIGGDASTDGGFTFRLGVTQRNFDIRNPPDSWGEFFTGRGFRGGGQTLTVEAAPGTIFQTYSVLFVEPALADSAYSLSVLGRYRRSNFREYDEERYGGKVGIGRTFGSAWSANLLLRNEWIGLDDLDPDSPVDLFRFADTRRLSGVGLNLSRTSVPYAERFVPTRGNRIELEAEQVGALGGGFDFTKLRAEYALYLPIHESFYGKTTVLSFSTRASYIPQGPEDVPPYERYYLGGQSFRGFALRAVSPIGIRNDTGTPGDTVVGGTWAFFAGIELRQPIPPFPEVISLVGFLDTGTVTNDLGFDDYRVSTGIGLRVLIPQLSQVPLAFDFGFPLIKEDTDRTRIFSFSIDVPFGR